MKNTIKAWGEVGKSLKILIEQPDLSPLKEAWEKVQVAAEKNNPWFRKQEIQTAVGTLAKMLDPEKLETWAANYERLPVKNPKTIGVIMAGNIPMAGFHDLLCVNVSGHLLEAKLSSSDQVLLPFITEILASYDTAAASRIAFTGNIKDADAIIATGSNNSSRYFDYYFGKKPHIFRKNRHSAAILTGEENEYDLILLGRDIMTYHGLGCRSVSKLFVPKGYDFDMFFTAMATYGEVMENNKYMNNYDYNNAVYLLNNFTFLTNNFIILMESTGLSSPVSVVMYEYYENAADLKKKLDGYADELQCVVQKNSAVALGQAQYPEVSDYADGIDTMQFLSGL